MQVVHAYRADWVIVGEASDAESCIYNIHCLSFISLSRRYESDDRHGGAWAVSHACCASLSFDMAFTENRLSNQFLF